MGVVIADEFNAIGEYPYAPDLSTLRLCPYEEGHTSVSGCFQEKAPVLDADGNLTVAVNFCPRSTLQRVVESISWSASKLLVEASNISTMASSGLPSGAVESRVKGEILESLLKPEIEVTMHHPKAAQGQHTWYVVVSGPWLQLQAADVLIYTRETIVMLPSWS
ncbi:hypothetical protein EDD18DRAFT_1347415 [Armillaria luteobubalina]|uniref:Uncharacterized protein n=1 Tax=Armillaria luteobubalina TaxID=153913 RepID=A0AA39TUZ6_9AGAR|nr:hypothetical protein EDD18DRAFT_1347415 [Armillaria luteobubalina]